MESPGWGSICLKCSPLSQCYTLPSWSVQQPNHSFQNQDAQMPQLSPHHKHQLPIYMSKQSTYTSIAHLSIINNKRNMHICGVSPDQERCQLHNLNRLSARSWDSSSGLVGMDQWIRIYFWPEHLLILIQLIKQVLRFWAQNQTLVEHRLCEPSTLQTYLSLPLEFFPF